MLTKENFKKYFPDFCRTMLLSVPIGIVCGLVGFAFANSVSFVTALREKYTFILYLLPISGLIVARLYRKLKLEGTGTNHIITSVRSDKRVSWLLGVAVFFGAALSHFGGASVGREGAALQMGGSVGEFAAEKLKIREGFRRIVVMSGMGACFAALFGTPFAAFIFVLEVVRVGARCLVAIPPVFLSSITGFAVANLLGVEPERMPVNVIPQLSFDVLWKVLLIAVVGAYVSELFVYSLHFSSKTFKKAFENPYLRVAVGGVIIILLTKIVGTTDYNGGGIGVIHQVFTEGKVNYEAFLLKLLFTAISIGVGYHGGEIVPTLFIGATFGGTAASLLGLDVAFGGAVGIVTMFSGATNCPVATVFLACEMFGIEGVGYYLVASALSFALSGKVSLYKGRKTPFVKNH